MPKKYHIKPKPTPNRFVPPGKYVIIEQDQYCLHCPTNACVKKDCPYDVYTERRFDSDELKDIIDYLCKGCFRCIQGCKNNAISRTINPEYLLLGDEYWTPEIITSTYNQAETGKIPVSGAGYGGPFTGTGFDSMWTDMSEIVRPTRDGIHGREYIATNIDLGKKLSYLEFDKEGGLISEPPDLLDIPIPIIFNPLPFGVLSQEVILAQAKAAKILGTFMIVKEGDLSPQLLAYQNHLIPLIDTVIEDKIRGFRMVEFPDRNGVLALVEGARSINPKIVTLIRLGFDKGVVTRVLELVKGGVDVIHLCADEQGKELDATNPRFTSEMIREVHLSLVEQFLRDNVTLLVSGGIADASHLAKAIISGVDGVAIDLPLLVALECRICRNCKVGLPCPVKIETVDAQWGASRIVNLMNAWHSQLIEVMGAMGIREARRLRGEVGRVMNFADLEEETWRPDPGPRTPNPEPRTPNPEPRVKYTPSRFKNPISRYILKRSPACIKCGTCVKVCQFGVHKIYPAGPSRPKEILCIGEACQIRNSKFEIRNCINSCPENALTLKPNPAFCALGDFRWTADLILSTWHQAETGKLPPAHLEYKIGASGGGFDKLEFIFPEPRTPNPEPRPKEVEEISEEEITTTISLNAGDEKRPAVEIDVPWYGGGMSFGSTALNVMIARAKAATLANTFVCTGEGGYPDALIPYDDHIITQIATGLFGVREETIQRVRIVEFKYAQGAKPGLGGHLLGEKVTPEVARMREAVVGTSLFSPFPFHSVYSIEDHKKHVDWIREVNPKGLVSVKVSTPTDVDMVAIGIYYAGAHIVHLDGSYGGTGAAPNIAKKNIAMPIEYAIPKVHKFLCEEGVRDKITLIASGGIRTAYDVAKAIALGANGCVIGTAELIALECVKCGNCESGRGCVRGIATTDPELSKMIDIDWATQRLINLYSSWRTQLVGILKRLGMRSIKELVGRRDCLKNVDYQ